MQKQTQLNQLQTRTMLTFCKDLYTSKMSATNQKGCTCVYQTTQSGLYNNKTGKDYWIKGVVLFSVERWSVNHVNNDSTITHQGH